MAKKSHTHLWGVNGLFIRPYRWTNDSFTPRWMIKYSYDKASLKRKIYSECNQYWILLRWLNKASSSLGAIGLSPRKLPKWLCARTSIHTNRLLTHSKIFFRYTYDKIWRCRLAKKCTKEVNEGKISNNLVFFLIMDGGLNRWNLHLFTPSLA